MFKKFVIVCTFLSFGHYTKIDAAKQHEPESYPIYVAMIVNVAKAPNINMDNLGEGHLCAGIIIGPHTILTAAHCVAHMPISNLRVVVGTRSRKTFTKKAQVFGVKKVFIHPRYHDEDVSAFDMALVKLRDPIREDNSTAQHIVLPAKPFALGGDMCTHLGWGRVSNDSERADDIQYVDLQIAKRRVCEKRLPPPQKLLGVFCAGEPERGGKKSCRGDSGGPIFCNGHLVGMAIAATDCHAVGPIYFTDVINFLVWSIENSYDDVTIDFRSSSGTKLKVVDNFYSKILYLIIFAITFLFG